MNKKGENMELNKRKKQIILAIIILGILLLSSFLFINKQEKNTWKEVNVLLSNKRQDHEYKLYEFGMKGNDISDGMDQIVAEVVKQYEEKIDFEFIDVTASTAIVNAYNINSIPTFIIIDKGGHVKYRTKGKMTKEELEQFILNIQIEK